MAKSQEESQAAVAHATESGSALGAIAEAVPGISEMTTQIAAGAAQTSDTVREVTRMTGGLQQLVAQFKV